MVTRRSNVPPTIEPKQFSSTAEIDRGIAKLRRRIDEVSKLVADGVRHDDAKVRNAETNIRETIREVFGQDSPEFHDHQHHDINHGGYSMGDTEQSWQRKFLEGTVQTTTMLEGLIGRLEEKRGDLSSAPPATVRHPVNADSSSVFVVHGHDDQAKLAAARFLEKLGLNPVILSERPDEGRTVVEKFERDSDVAYAVVLMTPDDMGHRRDATNESRPRARQNVILELGYFVGRLTRARVAVLHKGGVEIPSDYHGVLYIQMDDGGGWQLKLARELKHAGLNIDLNRAV